MWGVCDVSDAELVLAIREARVAWERRLEAGEVVVRKLVYVKKGASIGGYVAVEQRVPVGEDSAEGPAVR
jgi:hypothetical protein